jgi:hypothetical protein
MKSAVGLSVVVALLAWAGTSLAEQPPARADSIAVVALDDSEGTRQAVSRMGSMLASSGQRVEYGERLEKTLDARRMPKPTPETMRAFSGLSDVIADGIKEYFYQSKKQAMKTLKPVLELGLSETAALVERPDLVDQVYEAGLVLVRAHVDLGHTERAAELAATLVSHFPAKSPELRTAPPEIIELYRAKRKELAREKSRIVIESEAPESSDCTALLNGAAVAPGSHVVAANRPYYLRLDCGLKRSSMWRITLEPGEVESIVLIADDPLAVNLTDDSFASRRRAETYLRALASIGKYSEVVGVKRPDVNSGLTLFSHYRDGSFTWTEASDVSSVVRYTEDAFGVSEQPEATAETTATKTSGRRVDWLGWGLVGAGAASATVGALFLRAAFYNGRLLNCYDNVVPQQEINCSGVATVGLEISEKDQERETRKLRQQHAAAYAFFGLGAGALGYGIFRLVRGRPTVAMAIDPVRGIVSVHGRF